MKIEEISNKKQDYRKNYSHLERISTQCVGPTYGTRRKIVASSSLEIGLMPKEPLWLSFLLPILPILGIHFMSSKYFIIYLVQLIEQPILRILNFNFPNLRCCKSVFNLFNKGGFFQKVRCVFQISKYPKAKYSKSLS